ncbi:MAG: hypothetical protein GF421_11620 [Candidatus Aminicenantes bacterium]|nr:hypothetical protein [Candidatus Aminicenantes bacterium]
MNIELELLQTILRENDIKPTFIRLKILDYIEKNKKHSDTEEIYLAVKKEIPTISRTSVYNALDIFQEKGLIRPLFITGNETRYEIELSPHHHFLCKKCGIIIDLDMEYEYFKKKTIEGHKVIDIQGYFKGECKNCLKGPKSKKGE